MAIAPLEQQTGLATATVHSLQREMAAAVASVFARLEQAAIPHCVLRNREHIPASLLTGSDVDVIVPAGTAPEDLLRAVSDLRPVHVAVHRATMEVYFAVGNLLLHVDFLIADRQWRGARYLANSEILRGVWDDQGIAVASPVHQAFCAWFSSLLRMRRFKPRYGPLICRAVTDQPQAMHALLQSAFGAALADRLLQLARAEQWSEMDALAPRCRRAVWWRAAVRHPLATLAGAVRHYAAEAVRWIHPPGLAVAVLGPDGAGKSTVCSLLGAMPRSRLPFRGVEATHLYDRVLPMLSEIKQGRVRRSRRTPVTEHNPHGKSAHPLPVALLTVGYGIVDQWLSDCVFSRRKRSQNRLLLCDRHPRELLLDGKRFRFPGPAWLARMLTRLMPMPDLVILLDAPAEVLQRRKQEVPFEETQRQAAAYRAYVGSLPQGRIVDGTQPAEAIAEQIRNLLLETLRGRLTHRDRSGAGL